MDIVWRMPPTWASRLRLNDWPTILNWLPDDWVELLQAGAGAVHGWWKQPLRRSALQETMPLSGDGSDVSSRGSLACMLHCTQALPSEAAWHMAGLQPEAIARIPTISHDALNQ